MPALWPISLTSPSRLCTAVCKPTVSPHHRVTSCSAAVPLPAASLQRLADGSGVTRHSGHGQVRLYVCGWGGWRVGEHWRALESWCTGRGERPRREGLLSAFGRMWLVCGVKPSPLVSRSPHVGTYPCACTLPPPTTLSTFPSFLSRHLPASAPTRHPHAFSLQLRLFRSVRVSFGRARRQPAQVLGRSNSSRRSSRRSSGRR